VSSNIKHNTSDFTLYVLQKMISCYKAPCTQQFDHVPI